MEEATPQQKLFIDEWIKLRKRQQGLAAIRAGYSEKSADSQASQLLTNPKVQKYLKEREKAITEELQQEFVFDALEAREIMYDIMKKPIAEDRDRINVAKDFLDRAGFKPIEKQEIKADIDIGKQADIIEKYLKSEDKWKSG